MMNKVYPDDSLALHTDLYQINMMMLIHKKKLN